MRLPAFVFPVLCLTKEDIPVNPSTDLETVFDGTANASVDSCFIWDN